MIPTPPERETRQSIEQDLANMRRRRGFSPEDLEKFIARMEDEFVRMRAAMDPAAFAAVEARFKEGIRKISVQVRGRRRRPKEGGMPALVEPPRGPRPLSGGAAAPLEFDD